MNDCVHACVSACERGCMAKAVPRAHRMSHYLLLLFGFGALIPSIDANPSKFSNIMIELPLITTIPMSGLDGSDSSITSSNTVFINGSNLAVRARSERGGGVAVMVQLARRLCLLEWCSFISLEKSDKMIKK